MSARAQKTLAGHIGRSGFYPALIVHPHPHLAGKYEILDGHRRAEVLRKLGRRAARCEVWPVGPEEAELAAATLNTLRARPDARRRARQVRRLVERHGPQGAAERLGLTPRGLAQQLALLRPPRRSDGPAPLALQPVVFHLSAEQARRLFDALRRCGAGRRSRAEALLRAVERGGHAKRASHP